MVEVAVKKIKRKKLYEEVISRIVDMVKNNELKTGDKIHSEKDLGDIMGVSRMVIREALSALQSSGFLEVRHGSGIYLKNIDLLLYNGDLEVDAGRQQILNIMELRKGLEPEAAYLAALRADEEDKLEMGRLLDSMLEAVSRGKNASAEDNQFHVRIVAASNNPFYNKVFNDFIQPNYYEIQRRGHQFWGKTLGPRLEIVREHQAIFGFICEGQPDEARRSMWEHINNVELKMRKLFNLQ